MLCVHAHVVYISEEFRFPSFFTKQFVFHRWRTIEAREASIGDLDRSIAEKKERLRDLTRSTDDQHQLRVRVDSDVKRLKELQQDLKDDIDLKQQQLRQMTREVRHANVLQGLYVHTHPHLCTSCHPAWCMIGAC